MKWRHHSVNSNQNLFTVNKIVKNIFFSIGLIALGASLSYFTYDGMSDENFEIVFKDNYNIYALPIPEDLRFANEEVPLEDPEIMERLDREMLVNTYWQSQTMLFNKRIHRYFPVIEPILEKHGIPEDFKYLAVIESGLTNVVSPAGATGFWQIMEGTGKDYGLEINKEVDERYHLEKSTEVACKYLKHAYDELGSWTLAAASYNMGITGVKKQLERQGGNSYYDLTLNSETGRYLFRIMALKQILGNPEKYGFHFRAKDLYKPIPTYTVKVDTSVENFGSFANELGINYRILKYHNPWLRYDYLPNSSGKLYEIEIPEEGHFKLSPQQAASDKIKPDTVVKSISDSTTATDTTLVPDSAD